MARRQTLTRTRKSGTKSAGASPETPEPQTPEPQTAEPQTAGAGAADDGTQPGPTPPWYVPPNHSPATFLALLMWVPATTPLTIFLIWFGLFMAWAEAVHTILMPNAFPAERWKKKWMVRRARC